MKAHKSKTSTYLEVIIHANKLLKETCSILLPDKRTFKGNLNARHRNAAVQGEPAPSPQPTLPRPIAGPPCGASPSH